MSISPLSISKVVFSARQAMVDLEAVLNAADAKLGDGDTGGMLARVIDRMAETDIAKAADVGTALSQLAKAATIATGSSLGTLLATGLLAAGRQCRGSASIAIPELAPLIAAARDAMIARGGAALGDKTVLDSLEAIISALKDVDETSDVRRLVVDAAAAALVTFRQRPNRIGRARMFGDQTVGIDDPGMLAIAELAKALG